MTIMDFELETLMDRTLQQYCGTRQRIRTLRRQIQLAKQQIAAMEQQTTLLENQIAPFVRQSSDPHETMQAVHALIVARRGHPIALSLRRGMDETSKKLIGSPRE